MSPKTKLPKLLTTIRLRMLLTGELSLTLSFEATPEATFEATAEAERLNFSPDDPYRADKRKLGCKKKKNSGRFFINASKT